LYSFAFCESLCTFAVTSVSPKSRRWKSIYRSRFERMDLILQDSWRKANYKRDSFGWWNSTFFFYKKFRGFNKWPLFMLKSQRSWIWRPSQ
jgi:hypothetical protein